MDEEDFRRNGISANDWEQVEESGFTYMSEPVGAIRRVRTGNEIFGLTVMQESCVFSSEREIKAGEYSDE